MTTPDPLPLERLEPLWMRMTARYGHAWTSQYGAEDAAGAKLLRLAMAEWAESLAGLSDAQLRLGFARDARRGERWPPSAPAFAALCRGIPALAKVRFQLRKFGPAHSRFTRLTWTFIDAFEYRRADRRAAERMEAEAYELACDHVMRALPLPSDPSGVLPQEPGPRTPAKPETVAAAFAVMQRAVETPTEEESDCATQN